MKLHRNIDIFVPKATESAHGRVQSDFFLPQREKWAPYHAVRDVIGPGDKYFDTRSLGALRAPTSSWRPFGPLDFVLRALREWNIFVKMGHFF